MSALRENIKSIIFGTGGETIQGNLWIANLSDLMDEDLSNAVPLISNSQLGYLAPPSIGDLNLDDKTYSGSVTIKR